jgi:uroporphyrinogen decarboxylase
MVSKRERLEKTIAGELVDRVPVALWRHWPGDDQRAADLARVHLSFQQQYDWDLLVVVPSVYFMVTAYGLQDIWRGASSGKREISKTPITRSLHWTEIRPLEPSIGDMGKQLQCLQLMGDALDQQPVLQMIHSPLTQALYLAGKDTLLRSLRTQPERLRSGLNRLTETTLRFVDALHHQTYIDGIFYVIDAATFSLLSEAEYSEFGIPFDLKIIDALPTSWWMNMIQLNGIAPMVHLFTNFKVQALNWSDREARPSLERVQHDFSGAFCGGLGEESHLHLGTPTTVRDAARDAMSVMGRRRFILGCGSTVPVTAPLSNLRAAREVVESNL